MDISQITKELGIDKLPEDKQIEMEAQIVAMLQARVSLQIAELLDDEQQAYLEEVQESEGDEAVVKEIKNLVPEYQQIVQDELETLRQELGGAAHAEEPKE